jgi:hypothetical protein
VADNGGPLDWGMSGYILVFIGIPRYDQWRHMHPKIYDKCNDVWFF